MTVVAVTREMRVEMMREHGERVGWLALAALLNEAARLSGGTSPPWVPKDAATAKRVMLMLPLSD